MQLRKKKTTEFKGTMLLVTATEAEALFFSQMRKDCRFTNLNVVCSNAKTLKEIITFAARKKNQGKFDRTFCVFGLDDLNTTIEEIKRNEEAVANRRIDLCYFNPTFEMYFYFHLGELDRFVSDAEFFKSNIAKAVKDYEFTPEFLGTKGSNFHLQLFPRHATADLRIRDYNRVANQATGAKACGVVELNNAITEICGTADMSHNTRVFR